jgi:two-component system NtrC family sensor kinase
MRTWGGYDPAAAENYLRQFPMRPDRSTAVGRAILEQRIVHIRDVAADPEIGVTVRTMGVGSTIVIPLQRDGQSLGVIAIGLLTSGGFSDSQIELLRAFGEQAVIAITSAETHRALQTRTSDLQESLEYQTAVSDVLRVISGSVFDLEPIFRTVAATAVRLCRADQAGIYLRQGSEYRWAGGFSQLPEYEEIERQVRIRPGSGTLVGRVALEGHAMQILDAWTDPLYEAKEDARVGAIHTLLGVPLFRDGTIVGVIGIGRQKIEPFSQRQIELVSTFADQAVIAMENARLMTEQREALEQQTATAEVLQVINSSPGNLGPVFDAVLEKAMRLCGAAFGSLYTYDGERFRSAAQRGVPAAYAEFRGKNPPADPGGGRGAVGRLIKYKRPVHILDIKDEELYQKGSAEIRSVVELGGARTLLNVPLLRDDALQGYISIYRQEVRAFTDKEIALLENFAAQAVIAMENARLLDEIRQRQEELRITFENMGDGVALFDETRHLVASNQRFQHMLDVPDDVIASRPTFSDYIRYLADHGEYGPDPEVHVQQLLALGSRRRTFERTRPNGRIIEIRVNPVPGGGFVVIYADITERKRNEEEIRAARDAAEEANRTIEAAYRDLKAAQASLIQAEKMASLGQLTAGIAHEIKNPLNFVNNFAELSVDLLDELNEAVGNNRQNEVEELTGTLKGNLGGQLTLMLLSMRQ